MLLIFVLSDLGIRLWVQKIKTALQVQNVFVSMCVYIIDYDCFNMSVFVYVYALERICETVTMEV